MMAERGIYVSHTTILRWVLRYVPEYENRWARHARPVSPSWRMDETAISIGGRWHYLYRAVDRHGKSVDHLLRADMSMESAQAFFPKGRGNSLVQLAAQDQSGRQHGESPRAATALPRGCPLAVCHCAGATLPKQHRRAGSSSDQTSLRHNVGLQVVQNGRDLTRRH
jgi:hypothetical protein